MSPIAVGKPAPPIPGVTFGDGPVALVFYKVTCPVCQMAAPKVDRFERAYPGRIVGIGQDPQEELDAFADEFGMRIPVLSDPPPYEASDAYEIEAVPTLFLVGEEGTILEAVGAWDRDGYNRVSERLAGLVNSSAAIISEDGDGLPLFRPG